MAVTDSLVMHTQVQQKAEAGVEWNAKETRSLEFLKEDGFDPAGYCGADPRAGAASDKEECRERNAWRGTCGGSLRSPKSQNRNSWAHGYQPDCLVLPVREFAD